MFTNVLQYQNKTPASKFPVPTLYRVVKLRKNKWVSPTSRPVKILRYFAKRTCSHHSTCDSVVSLFVTFTVPTIFALPHLYSKRYSAESFAAGGTISGGRNFIFRVCLVATLGQGRVVLSRCKRLIRWPGEASDKTSESGCQIRQKDFEIVPSAAVCRTED